MQKPPELTKKTLIEYGITALILLSMVIMVIVFREREFSYAMYNTSTNQYVRGKVVEIVDEQLTHDREYTMGYQLARVEIKQGTAKGQTVEIENFITATHNVVLKEGLSIIICADIPEGVEPYYMIYNYDRSFGTFALIAAFIALVIVIGGKKGVMSSIGLLFTVCMVICILLPELFEGSNALVVSIITIILSSAVSCFCIGGLSEKTKYNIISTVLGVVSAGIVYYIFMLVLHISGPTMSEAELLSVVANTTGLKLGGILIASVLVSSLGAVMDVAVSMCASLTEIREINPKITSKELFRSGMNIGRDMIGTMTNTLILAFTGGALANLILFLSYGIQFHQLVSSNFLALEIATGISGSAAVVLTVPISAAVTAFGIKNRKNKKIKKKG